MKREIDIREILLKPFVSGCILDSLHSGQHDVVLAKR